MSRPALLALIPLVLTACPPGGGGGDASAGNTTTTGVSGDPGDSGDTIPTEGGDPGFNPNYRRILSGTTLDAAYTRVRVGHLDLPDADGCCADYVLAGSAHKHVKILFGAPSRGLLFLSDVPDQTFDMGPAGVGIEDIVVADYDEDGHDDVLALRSDGVVGIRRGLDAAAPDPVLSDTLIEASMTFTGSKGSRSLVLADLNCAGKKDLVVVSPEDDSVLRAIGVPGPLGDTFAGVLPESTGVGTSPQQVVVGDLNGDNKPDIVTGNGNLTASVLLNKCPDQFEPAVNYPVFLDTAPTPDMQLAIGRMCLGETTRDWPAIALGHGDKVWVLCGNAEGRFDQVGEEPSAAFGTAVDYIMDSNEAGGPSGSTIFQLQYWEPTSSLHVFWSGTTEISRFVPSPTFGQVQDGEPVADLAGRNFIMNESHKSFVLYRPQVADSAHWTHIIRLVQGGSATDVSFAR